MRASAMKMVGAAALGVGALISSAAKASPIEFATFDLSNADTPFTWTNNGGTSGTMSASTGVQFTFTNQEGSAAGTYNATLNITGDPATFVPASKSGSTDIQPLSNPVTLTITDNAIPPGPGHNLLTAVFTNASLYGIDGETNGVTAGDVNITGQSVLFTSDYRTFPDASGNSFVLDLNTLSTGLSIGPGGFLNSFASNVDGQFSANAVPEPASLGLISLAGLGLLRRRVRSSR